MLALAALCGRCLRTPWTASSDEIALRKLEWVLGAYSDGFLSEWCVDVVMMLRMLHVLFMLLLNLGQMVVWLKMTSS